MHFLPLCLVHHFVPSCLCAFVPSLQVSLQLIPKRQSRPEQPALQRPQRQTQHIRHLLVIESFHIAHHQHRAIFRIQFSQRRQHLLALLFSFALLGRRADSLFGDSIQQRRSLIFIPARGLSVSTGRV